MKIRFWGVRGSIPTPLSPEQVQSKIMAAVMRISEKDLKSQETRARFVANLPSWIFGTTGGNTACVEIQSETSSGEQTEIILDAGSGIRSLGKRSEQPKNAHYHILFSHLHWDHISGLPFFDPAYNQKSRFDYYSHWDSAEKYLRFQMQNPFYPVTFDSFTKNYEFHTLNEGESFNIDEIKVNSVRQSHPGSSYAFSFLEKNDEKSVKFVYATDVELKANDFGNGKNHEEVFKNADCIVLDSQYTVEEACQKQNWGHSAFCYAIDFAVYWNIKKLYLFHHEPVYDDKKLNSLLKAARWYAKYVVHSDIEIHLAREDLTIVL